MVTDDLDPERLVSQQLDVALLLGVRLARVLSDRFISNLRGFNISGMPTVFNSVDVGRFLHTLASQRRRPTDRRRANIFCTFCPQLMQKYSLFLRV